MKWWQFFPPRCPTLDARVVAGLLKTHHHSEPEGRACRAARAGTCASLQQTCCRSSLGQPTPRGRWGPPQEEVSRPKCPAGCSQRLGSCVRVGVRTELETWRSGVPSPFFLPRQQALFHVLSAYSVYNTVSSETGHFQRVVLALYMCIL